MLITNTSLLNVPIVSLQTGSEIAQTNSLIIDPRQLRVIAFYCKGTRLDIDPAILLIEDIREVSRMGFIVDSADILMRPEDLVRLKDVIGFRFNLDNKQVVEDTGRKVGSIVSYDVDNTTFYLTKLHVRPGLLASFKTAELLIGRDQIVEVNDKQVVVRSATIKQGSRSRIASPIVDSRLHPSGMESARLNNKPEN